MLYRKFGATGKELSILGFGCMRLPVLNDDTRQIDERKATEMLRHAIDQGVNYIDTAYPYHGMMSEPFLGKALQDGYRAKVNLATKLPSWLIETSQDMDRYLNEQLERLQTEHIDFYLVHAFNRDRWNNLNKLGVFEFLNAAIADGRIGYAGFSFHDGLGLFKEIVDAYDWSFCQIQYNYLDENYQAGREGLEYAIARGMGTIIMEPLRGGKLASDIPADIQAVWDKAEIKRTPAEWGLRFLWDNPGIGVVLSGMTEMSHVTENLRVAGEGHPLSLTDKERNLIDEVKCLYKSMLKVNCTTCQYCLPCPEGVNIPSCFSQLNNAALFGHESARAWYETLEPEKRASRCVSCGSCEPSCPQGIPIRKMLHEVVQVLEV